MLGIPLVPMEMRGPDFEEEFGSQEQWEEVTKKVFDELWEQREEYRRQFVQFAENKGRVSEELMKARFYDLWNRISEIFEEHGFVFKGTTMAKFMVFFVTGDSELVDFE